jgi:hypothetical protein
MDFPIATLWIFVLQLSPFFACNKYPIAKWRAMCFTTPTGMEPKDACNFRKTDISGIRIST